MKIAFYPRRIYDWQLHATRSYPINKIALQKTFLLMPMEVYFGSNSVYTHVSAEPSPY